MKKYITIGLLLSITTIWAQNPIYKNRIYKNYIKSVQLELAGWEVSYPILSLQEHQQLLLSFDDLSEDIEDYSYRLIHCNANWTPSDLAENEYLDGFVENQITSPRASFNTFQHFYHYKLKIPNDDVNFKISGNYILKVYRNYDEEDIVLIRRFSVNEAVANIRGSVTRSSLSKYYRTHQQVDFRILLGNIQVNDPFSDVKIAVVQNNIWDLAKTNLQAQFVNENELIYEDSEENSYPAFNEFRTFDIKTLKYNMEHVARIFFEDKQYFVRLFDDEERRFKVYLSNSDINGSYIIRNREYKDFEVDADYAWVYFYLPMPEPVTDGNMYIYGALTDWETSAQNKMLYNYERKAYQLKLLLKQGYYNFEYVFANPEKNIIDPSRVEGSHYETENDYVIYVYVRGFGDHYDRLVGVNILNYPKDNKTLIK